MGSIHDTTVPVNDAELLTAKYRHERNKRLREDGIYQYRDVTETSLKHFTDDPWSAPITRDPIQEEIDFAIIGGGFAGLLVAVRLFEVGLQNVKIIDKAGDFGGTWYYNRYPGIACDIESYIYMPLCEELGYVPSEKYAPGSEIFEHARKIGHKYNLYDKALFQTEALEIDWFECENRWIIKTTRGDVIKAKFVATAGGPLHKPKLPGVTGIEKFKGHSFHTSRWDYEYTGGSSKGDLTGLRDKRVGVIGTGATAVQVLPHLAQNAKHLYVFQRTPPAVDVRNNSLTDPEWAKGLPKGWQQKRMDNFNAIIDGAHEDEDLVNDGWTHIFRTLAPSGPLVQKFTSSGDGARAVQLAMEEADNLTMEKIRRRVDSVVKDRKTAEALKPWYRRMCKRPCFHDGYLDIFNRENVTLVDTDGKGVECVTEKGIIANGQEIELDCIIYATGFEYGTDYSRRLGATVRGRNGVTLADYFKDGMRTLHSFYVRGFPNYFILSIAQSGTSANLTHNFNDTAKHLAWLIKEMRDRGVSTVEVSAEAEEAWVETIKELGQLRESFYRECTPGFFNDEGKLTTKGILQTRYGLGCLAFKSLIEEWRAQGNLPGLELDGKLLTTTPVATRPSSKEANKDVPP